MSEQKRTNYYKKYFPYFKNFSEPLPSNQIQFISQALYFPWIIEPNDKYGPIVWVLHPDYIKYLKLDQLYQLDFTQIAPPFSISPSIPIDKSIVTKPIILNDQQRKRLIDIILTPIHQTKEDCWFWSCNIFIWIILSIIGDQLAVNWSSIDIGRFIEGVKVLYSTKGEEYWTGHNFIYGGYTVNALVKLIELYFGIKNLPILQYPFSSQYGVKQQQLIMDHQFAITRHFLTPKNYEDNLGDSNKQDGDIINVNLDNRSHRRSEGTEGHAVVIISSLVVSPDGNEEEKILVNNDEKETKFEIPDKVKKSPKSYYLIKDSGGGINYYYVRDNSAYGNYLKSFMFTVPWELIINDIKCIQHFNQFYKTIFPSEEMEEPQNQENTRWRKKSGSPGVGFFPEYYGERSEGLKTFFDYIEKAQYKDIPEDQQ